MKSLNCPRLLEFILFFLSLMLLISLINYFFFHNTKNNDNLYIMSQIVTVQHNPKIKDKKSRYLYMQMNQVIGQFNLLFILLECLSLCL